VTATVVEVVGKTVVVAAMLVVVVAGGFVLVVGETVVVEPSGKVVVVAPGSVVVLSGNVVVVAPPTVVVVAGTVVVVAWQGHASEAGLPTATFKQTSASEAVVGSVPFGAHTHAANGSHVRSPTAIRRMARQSAAVGALPPVKGCAQSPCAASAMPVAPMIHAAPYVHASLTHRRIATSYIESASAACRAASPPQRTHRLVHWTYSFSVRATGRTVARARSL
jgi:hypothetical protein